MDVVNADVRREPAQDVRQVIVGTALQCGLVKAPGLITGPGRVLELVLDIEQPDADRRSQNHDRQVHQQEGSDADQPDQRGDQNRDGGIRTHRTQPGRPAVTHLPYWQPMPQDEQIGGTYAEHHDRMPVQAIEDPTPSRPRDKLTDGQHVNVADASLVEIARARVMARMAPSPVIVRREGCNADRAANPIVRKAAMKERPVTAIMLDHEETDDQARRRHDQQQATPIAMDKNNPHHSPDDKEGTRRDRQFEHAACIVGLAITGELLCQRAGF